MRKTEKEKRERERVREMLERRNEYDSTEHVARRKIKTDLSAAKRER